MNIEIAFIKKLLITRDFVTVADKQITDQYFSGKYRNYFKFIRTHMTTYGQVPGMKVFKKKFKGVTFPESIPDESLKWYCDELRTKKKHNTIVGTIEEVHTDLENLDSEEAYMKIKQLVLKVENEVILSDRMVVNRDTEKRKQDYYERAKAGGMTGVPSFIDRLDYLLKGFNPGELITLLGYTGTGKSWFEIILAVAQARAGYKVLFFTTEMSTSMVMRRVDAVWANLSYSRFKDAKLHPDELATYHKYLDEQAAQDEELLIVEQANGGVSQISAKIDQYDPDMVYIDGAYLLADEEGDNDADWKPLVRIWRQLHKLALAKHLPIFVTTQSKEKKISLSAISFAKAIAQDCDVIMGIEQDEQMYEDREMKLTFHKIREGTIPGAVMMEWDFDAMKYGTIYMEGRDEFLESQHEQQQEKKAEARNKTKNAGKDRVQTSLKKPAIRKATKRKQDVPEGVQTL